MKRNLLVIVVVVAVLAVMVWAGLTNYRKRAAEKARSKQIEAVLSQTQTAGADAPQASSDNPVFVNPLADKQAPEFKLTDTTGRKVSLSSYRGKAVVIDFWATWCAPCKIEIPWLTKLRDQYAGQGLEVLGVSEDDLDLDDPSATLKDKREIAEAATKLGIHYPVLYDDANVAKPYGGVEDLPTTFFVDRSGKVVAATVGLVDRDEIEADIKKALAGGTAKGQS